jgi:hypothetical protein
MEIRESVLQADFVETPSAEEAVLFSNTASFLLHRLRQDSSAFYVAQKLRTAEIVDSLEAFCKTPPASPVDLLWCYVFLAALSLKIDLRTFKGRLNGIDLSRVQWGNEIRSAITEERTPSNYLDVQYEDIRNNRQAATSTYIADGIVFAGGKEQ